jgi:tetratricopeptide (TPR) repeat protein
VWKGRGGTVVGSGRVAFRIRPIVRTIAVLAVVVACTDKAAESPGPSAAAMTPAEARSALVELKAARGMKAKPPQAVASTEELLAIVLRDDIDRFEDAARFLEGKTGIDALTWSATVELLWSEAYGTIALFARELGHRAEAEATRLGEKRDAGREFTERDKELLARATEGVAFNAKAEAALGVLSRDHLSAGSDFAREALRQSPDDERTLRVAAFYYLSTGMWARYEQVMTALEASAANDAPLLFLRALEAERRRGDRAEARQYLQHALVANPRLVRAQAKLVLLQDDIASSYAELQKLEALSPDHPVVRITGPSIKSEYELSESFDRARSKTLP